MKLNDITITGSSKAIGALVAKFGEVELGCADGVTFTLYAHSEKDDHFLLAPTSVVTSIKHGDDLKAELRSFYEGQGDRRRLTYLYVIRHEEALLVICVEPVLAATALEAVGFQRRTARAA